MNDLTQKLAISIAGEQVNYTVVQTDAPKAYDGFGTFTIEQYDNERSKDFFRWVLIRDEQLEWQTCRYSSGLKYSRDPEYAPMTAITQRLWEKLTA